MINSILNAIKFKFYLGGIDNFKNPAEKLKFLDEKLILLNKNREDLERKIKQIGNSGNENETGNNFLHQKLVKLNELEKRINVGSFDLAYLYFTFGLLNQLFG